LTSPSRPSDQYVPDVFDVNCVADMTVSALLTGLLAVPLLRRPELGFLALDTARTPPGDPLPFLYLVTPFSP